VHRKRSAIGALHRSVGRRVTSRDERRFDSVRFKLEQLATSLELECLWLRCGLDSCARRLVRLLSKELLGRRVTIVEIPVCKVVLHLQVREPEYDACNSGEGSDRTVSTVAQRANR